MKLSRYSKGDFTPGTSLVRQILWYFVGAPLVRATWMPVSCVKVVVLRLFGAAVGRGVTVKPGVRVKFPWRLTVGDHVWIGEDAWIDNLAEVRIGSNVCVSQGAYLCTGSHDWKRDDFALRLGSIVLEDEAWIAARAVVGPGVTVRRRAVLALGSVAVRDLPEGMICQGNPAVLVKERGGEGK